MRSSIATIGRRIALAGALALTTIAAPIPVAAAAPGECAPIMSVGNIHAGQTGIGWTVTRGDVPKQFNVEILGVLANGIAPGRDMVIFEASDVAGSNFIAKNGIWSGMSGSPVYINGKLAGAVAYGFSPVLSPIGGITPAAYMDDILDYGSSAATAADASARNSTAIPRELRATIAARSGMSEAQAGTMSRLPVPVAISGASSRALDRLESGLERRGMRVIVTSGGRAAAPSVSADRPVPGGNFAAVLSYGDISAAGIGTTTYVCGDQALAFGHPMRFMGRSAYGANDANAITIFSDPVYGSFKLASVTDSFGTTDQDRLAGIRAALGDEPNLVPVTSRVTSLDTGNVENNASQVTMDDFVADVAFTQLLTAIDLASDHGASAGSTRTRWTISGRRENGNPWSYTNQNRHTSQFDISYDTAFALGDEVFAIFSNPYEDISFTSVDFRAWVEDDLKQGQVVSFKVSKNGGTFKTVEFMTVHPGDTLRVRVKVRAFPVGPVTTLTLAPLVVPGNAFGEASLIVQGGGDQDPDQCAFNPGPSCPGGFMGQIAALDSLPRNDTVISKLAVFDFGTFEYVDLDREVAATNRVTYGTFEVPISIEP